MLQASVPSAVMSPTMPTVDVAKPRKASSNDGVASWGLLETSAKAHVQAPERDAEPGDRGLRGKGAVSCSDSQSVEQISRTRKWLSPHAGRTARKAFRAVLAGVRSPLGRGLGSFTPADGRQAATGTAVPLRDADVSGGARSARTGHHGCARGAPARRVHGSAHPSRRDAPDSPRNHRGKRPRSARPQ
jgi:hypothetical protein